MGRVFKRKRHSCALCKPHKMGWSPATDRDNSGNRIIDPATADRGSYVDFCGYFIVMHGHVKIR